jgi:hypothetical protein
MTLKNAGCENRRVGICKPISAWLVWLMAGALMGAPDLAAQVPALSVALRAGATGIMPSGIVRTVPHSSGGDRAARVGDAAALSIGLSFSTSALPAAIRLSATRSVGASLEQAEHYRRPCGTGCTGTSVEYEHAGDASVTVLAADLEWTPPVRWIVGPYLVVGLFRKTLAYDQSDLASDIEPYFRSSDTAHGFRFGGGLTSRLQSRVQLSAELLHQRGTAGAPGIPEIGEFWPRQRDFVLSAGVAVRVR